MKTNLLLILLLTAYCDCFSQDLKINTDTQLYTFTKVISVEGKTQDQLFTSIKEWIAINYRSANSVIQSADRDAGNIVVKGSFKVNEGIRFTGDVLHTIILDFKDGKMRFEATHFAFQAERARDGYPFEGNWATGKKGLEKLVARSEEFCNESILSMEKYLSTSKKKDW
jgi:hypothetical protein